ncbi:MAG TPA: DUF4956 domain-containing protein [Bacteroidetes bacterium]|nr:DUF4956 domain-containing protein [Bacteroidota bacterium]
MFDFSSISTNTENPTFLGILFTVLFSFLMSVIIAFTYEKTSRQVARPDNYIQALVLIAIVAATIMQAIGDSLARGLGMLGALSIIRFRTTLRNARNIVFMFGSLAAGIACGVGGYIIALVGTVGLCTTAFLLRLTPFSKQQNLVGTLLLEIPNGPSAKERVQKVLQKHCSSYALKTYRVFNSEAKAHLLQYRYQLKLKNEMNGWILATELKAMPEVQRVRLQFRDMEDII